MASIRLIVLYLLDHAPNQRINATQKYYELSWRNPDSYRDEASEGHLPKSTATRPATGENRVSVRARARKIPKAGLRQGQGCLKALWRQA